MRSRLSLVLTFALAVTSVAAAVDAPPGEKPNLTVATFNINWGNPDLDAVVHTIAQSRADLVALQETNDESARVLRRRLAEQYPHIKFHGPTGKYLAGGFGFLSKLPLEKVSYLEPKAGLFGAWMCEVSIAGQRVQIVNVHLQPFSLDAGAGVLEAIRMIAKVEGVHKEEIRRIGGALSKEMPVIVLGDFNSPASLAAPQYLIKQGFVDSFASVTKEPDRHPTWFWRWGNTDLSYRLDYIFHARGISTAESRILKTNASDHYLVVSKLRIPGRPDAPRRHEDAKK